MATNFEWTLRLLLVTAALLAVSDAGGGKGSGRRNSVVAKPGGRGVQSQGGGRKGIPVECNFESSMYGSCANLIFEHGDPDCHCKLPVELVLIYRHRGLLPKYNLEDTTHKLKVPCTPADCKNFIFVKRGEGIDTKCFCVPSGRDEPCQASGLPDTETKPL